MAIGLFEIDKAGDDTLTKNYSVVSILNRERIYGFRIPQKMQKILKNEFDRGILGIEKRFRFVLRFHIAIIILLIRETIKENKELSKYKIEICNDYDGHFHEIKDMVFKNLRKDVFELKKEDIVPVRFERESLVNKAAHKFYKKEENKLENCKICDLKLEDLRKLIEKKW